jgi:hypothetical protein
VIGIGSEGGEQQQHLLQQKKENVGLSSRPFHPSFCFQLSFPPFILFPCDKEAGGWVGARQTNKQTNTYIVFDVQNSTLKGQPICEAKRG